MPCADTVNNNNTHFYRYWQHGVFIQRFLPLIHNSLRQVRPPFHLSVPESQNKKWADPGLELNVPSTLLCMCCLSKQSQGEATKMGGKKKNPQNCIFSAISTKSLQLAYTHYYLVSVLFFLGTIKYMILLLLVFLNNNYMDPENTSWATTRYDTGIIKMLSSSPLWGDTVSWESST